MAARAVTLCCAFALAGCGYIVTPHDDATPTPAIAAGEWTAVATKVEAASGALHVDLSIRNDTGDWSAMGIDNGGSVKLVASNGDTTRVRHGVRGDRRHEPATRLHRARLHGRDEAGTTDPAALGRVRGCRAGRRIEARHQLLVHRR